MFISNGAILVQSSLLSISYLQLISAILVGFGMFYQQAAQTSGAALGLSTVGILLIIAGTSCMVGGVLGLLGVAIESRNLMRIFAFTAIICLLLQASSGIFIITRQTSVNDCENLSSSPSARLMLM